MRFGSFQFWTKIMLISSPIFFLSALVVGVIMPPEILQPPCTAGYCTIVSDLEKNSLKTIILMALTMLGMYSGGYAWKRTIVREFHDRPSIG